MVPFDLEESLERAKRRLGEKPARRTRSPRSDRGASRLDPSVLALVEREVSGRERPRMKDLLGGLARRCRERGLTPPSRATVYKLLATLPLGVSRKGDLPDAVQDALYNLEEESEVPAHQIAFACLNYGDPRAVSFAAGLPWLALYQARRMRGYRPKSRGLLEAIARARRI